MSNEEARYHFPAPTKMEPLTLDQLRGMNGQPVWVECLEDQNRSGWRLIFWDRGKYLVLLHTSLYGFLLDDYGKTWRAYAYKPSKIDREALCGEWQGEADGYADGELVYDVWRCGDCGHVEETDDPDLLPRFCPSCGRAMTPEAWSELEKRLMG